MKTDVTISVVMGIYNQWNKEELNKAVESILNQSFGDFEFIIYDDGSHPEVADTIKALEKLDDRICVHRQEENNGLAFSLNTCIRFARGKYIARMDADDISEPSRLQRQYDFLESHKEYSWCGCNAYLFDEDGVWGKQDMTEHPQKKDYLRYSPYIHPSVMYRSEIFEKYDGYRESQETLRCEDYEIFMRLYQNGLRGYNIQEYLFRYRESSASYKKRTMKTRINEAKVRYKNFSKMKMLFPFGWIYVTRPIVGGLVPHSLLSMIKRKKKGIKNEHRKAPKTIPTIPFEGQESL